MTGVDDPYEPPTDPELEIDTVQVPLSEAVERTVALIVALTEPSTISERSLS